MSASCVSSVFHGHQGLGAQLYAAEFLWTGMELGTQLQTSELLWTTAGKQARVFFHSKSCLWTGQAWIVSYRLMQSLMPLLINLVQLD